MTMNRDDLALIEGCRQSPNLFASFVMGFEQGDIHKQMQRFLTNNNNCYIEYPRGHGKTAQMSLRVAWEVGRDPTVRIKYVQQSDVEAKKTTGLMKSKPEIKKLETMNETNLDIVASAAELRKDYETLYRQLRGIVYPKR